MATSITIEKGLADNLEMAMKRAEDGQDLAMAYALSIADRCAHQLGKDISGERERIRATGYAAALRVYLGMAAERASQGQDYSMECALSIAERCAAQAGRDISAERTAIEATGYAAALRVNLEMAAERASQGQDYSMECALSAAERYAEKSGTEISAQVAEIRASLRNQGGN